MGWDSNAKVISHIKSMLGFPKRAIELDKSNYEAAVHRALTKLSSTKPLFKIQSFNILAGSQAYDLSEGGLDLPYGRGVTDVQRAPLETPYTEFNVFQWWRMRTPPHIEAGDIVMDTIYQNEVANVTGTRFDWMWYPDTKIILLTPTPVDSRLGAYEYNAIPSDITEVGPADKGWVVDYALALTKEMLGRVRGKFKGIPGTEISVDTDASELLSEAQQEKEALEEKLGKNQAWVTPIKG